MGAGGVCASEDNGIHISRRRRMAKTEKRGPAVDVYCNCSWRGNRAETISSTELKRVGGVDSRGI